jgi:hypothetical protein
VPNLQKHEGVSAYLDAQLRATPADSMLEVFERRSHVLAEREDKLREQRLPELRALGFAVEEPSARIPHSTSSISLARRDSTFTDTAGF